MSSHTKIRELSIDGSFVGIEVKGANGALSPDQHDFKSQLEKASGKYFVVRSIEDAIAAGL